MIKSYWLDKYGHDIEAIGGHITVSQKLSGKKDSREASAYMYLRGYLRISTDEHGLFVDAGGKLPDFTRDQRDWLLEKSLELGLNGIITIDDGRGGKSINLSESLYSLKSLLEAPLTTFQTIGDFDRGHSYTSKVDRALIKNPVHVQKVKDFFKNTEKNFDFYFVNTKEARHYTEVGKVTPEFIFDQLNIKPTQLANGRIERDNITVFFTNNKGDEKVPMTAWMIAHRFAHVVAREYHFKDELFKWTTDKLNEILENFSTHLTRGKYSQGYGDDSYRSYRKAIELLCNQIGTFKSARDFNLRNPFEFHCELLAQYLKTGEAKFNKLPSSLITGYAAFGRKQTAGISPEKLTDAQEILDDFARDYPYYAETALGSIIGDIFVM